MLLIRTSMSARTREGGRRRREEEDPGRDGFCGRRAGALALSKFLAEFDLRYTFSATCLSPSAIRPLPPPLLDPSSLVSSVTVYSTPLFTELCIVGHDILGHSKLI